MDAVAQQHWFADAHALVLLAPRFDRSFWKYRRHGRGARCGAVGGDRGVAVAPRQHLADVQAGARLQRRAMHCSLGR